MVAQSMLRPEPVHPRYWPLQSAIDEQSVPAPQQASGTPFAAGQSWGVLPPQFPHAPRMQWSPEQQSPSTPQLSPDVLQLVGLPQTCSVASQSLLQHSTLAPQAEPSGTHWMHVSGDPPQ